MAPARCSGTVPTRGHPSPRGQHPLPGLHPDPDNPQPPDEPPAPEVTPQSRSVPAPSQASSGQRITPLLIAPPLHPSGGPQASVPSTVPLRLPGWATGEGALASADLLSSCSEGIARPRIEESGTLPARFLGVKPPGEGWRQPVRRGRDAASATRLTGAWQPSPAVSRGSGDGHRRAEGQCVLRWRGDVPAGTQGAPPWCMSLGQRQACGSRQVGAALGTTRCHPPQVTASVPPRELAAPDKLPSR